MRRRLAGQRNANTTAQAEVSYKGRPATSQTAIHERVVKTERDAQELGFEDQVSDEKTTKGRGAGLCL